MSSSDKNNAENLSPGEVLSPGDRLRRAREACDLSRGEVASHLKLSIDKIESLERGDVEKIAAPVFVAGYLRSYAKLVNLSSDEIVEGFKELTAMEAPSMDPSSGPAANDYGRVGKASSLNISLGGSSSLGAVVMWGVIIVLLIAAVYYFLANSEEVSTIKNTSNKEIGVTSPEKNSLPDVSRKGEVPEKMPPTNVEMIEPSSAIEGSLKKKDIKAVIPTPFSSSISPLVSSSDESRNSVQVRDNSASAVFSELTFYFTEESWIEVNDSQDKRLLYRLGKAGMSQTVVGLAPFNVRLGYVNGVSIMFNGEPYDLSHYANRRSVRLLIGEKNNQMSGGQ